MANHYDESSEPVEQRSGKEEAAVWGMLPLMAIIGAVVLLVLAMVAAWQGWLAFALPILVGLLLLGFMTRAARRRGM